MIAGCPDSDTLGPKDLFEYICIYIYIWTHTHTPSKHMDPSGRAAPAVPGSDREVCPFAKRHSDRHPNEDSCQMCVCVCSHVFPCLLLGCHARLCLKCADLLDATASNLGHCFTHPRRGEEIRACSSSSIGPQTLNPKTLNPSLPLMKPFLQRRATAQAYAKQFKAQVQ